MQPEDLLWFLKDIKELGHLTCLLFKPIFYKETVEDKFILFCLLSDMGIITIQLNPIDFFKMFLTPDGSGINNAFVENLLIKHFNPLISKGLPPNYKYILIDYAHIIKEVPPSKFLIDFYKTVDVLALHVDPSLYYVDFINKKIIFKDLSQIDFNSLGLNIAPFCDSPVKGLDSKIIISNPPYNDPV